MTQPTHSQAERERASKPQPGPAPEAEAQAALGEAAPRVMAGGVGGVDPRLSAGGAAQRARLLRQIQRVQGNGHAERLLAGAGRQGDREAGRPGGRETGEPAAGPMPGAEAPRPVALRAPGGVAPGVPFGTARDHGGGGGPEARRAAGAPVQRLFEGGILRAVAGFARNLPGYSMLGLLIGRDPITGEEVERTPKNVLRAVMGLAPMGDTLFQQLDEAGAIDRVFGWVEGQIAQLGLSWGAIKGLFKQAWDALSATDLLSPGKAWDKLKAIFTAPIARLRSFAAGIGQQVMQFIFEVVMEKLGGGQVVSLLQRAGGAFGAIIKDPIGFLGNLLSGVRLGFTNFVANILTHLKSGLMGWLFGEVAKSGISLPARFDMKGILDLVLQVLGLTWTFVRGQAAKALGEPVVSKLETGFALFKAVKEQGIGGLWEQLKEQLGGLKDSLIEGAKDLVITQVIQAGVQWLLGLLAGPAGAIVKAIQTTYSVVMWIVNNGSRLMALMNSVVDSLGAIAGGAVGQAAGLIERSLGQAVPVVIGFLASLLGLGGLGQKIRGVIEKLQAPVRKAIGWVLGKAKGYAQKFLAKVKGAFGGKPETEAQKQQRLQKGLRAGVAAVNKLKGKPLSGPVLNLALAGVRKFYKLSLLEPFVKDQRWAVRADIQRSPEQVTDVPASDRARDQQYTIGGLQMSGTQILLMIRKVARDIYNDDEVTRAMNQTDQEEFSQGVRQIASARRQRESERPGFGTATESQAGTSRSWEHTGGPFKTNPREEQLAVIRQQQAGAGPVVRGVGHYQHDPELGPRPRDISTVLDAADQDYRNVGEQRIKPEYRGESAAAALLMQTHMRSGKVDDQVSASSRQNIVAAADVMFGSETTRSPSAIVTSAMLIDLAASEHDPERRRRGRALTWNEQFERFPFAEGGAEATSDRVNKDLGAEDFIRTGKSSKKSKQTYAEKAKPFERLRKGGRPRAAVERWQKKEIQLAIDWVESTLKQYGITVKGSKPDAKGRPPFTSPSELEAFIRQEMRKFYGMREKNPE